MSANTQVIRAAQQFTKNGRSKDVHFVRELLIGGTLGIAAGFTWKTWHWNEKRKIEQYYYDLHKMDKLTKEAL